MGLNFYLEMVFIVGCLKLGCDDLVMVVFDMVLVLSMMIVMVIIFEMFLCLRLFG